MARPVKLQGRFDKLMKKAARSAAGAKSMLFVSRIKQQMTTQEFVNLLQDLANFAFASHMALDELAAKVRDD